VSLGNNVALEIGRTGKLTHRESTGLVSWDCMIRLHLKLTIQARGIAHGGISSLQKSSTVERAVISKGISKALERR